MKITGKLALRNLKLNKRRSIVTIIGITLAVALIVVVSTVAVSLRESIITYDKYVNGDYHYMFMYVDDEQIRDFEQNVAIESIMKVEELGYAYLDDVKTNDKHYAKILATDSASMGRLGLSILSGRYPENENEIVIAEHLRQMGRSSIKIGDSIELEVGTLVSLEEEPEAVEAPSMEIMPGSQPEVKLADYYVENAVSHTYKVVGIIRRNGAVEEYKDPGYTFLTYKEKPQGRMMVFVRLYCSVLGKSARIAAGILGLDPDKYEKYVNREYSEVDANYYEEIKAAPYKVITRYDLINAESLNPDDYYTRLILIIGTVIVLIILFTSVYCIKNSFDISLSEKTKQYGSLSGIGATKKQLRKCVLTEAVYMGAIGLPLGLAAGAGLSYLTIRIADKMLQGIMPFDIAYRLSLPAVAISIILGVLTVYFSALGCAKKASSIAPISAMRGHTDIKSSRRNFREAPWIKKIWGIGGVIAKRAMQRNGRKYRTTVVSIIICTIVFIVTSFGVDMGLKIVGLSYEHLDYNLYVWLYDIKQNAPEIQNFFDMSDNKQVVAIDTVNAFTSLPRYDSNYEKLMANTPDFELNREDHFIPLYGISNAEFDAYAAAIGVDTQSADPCFIMVDSGEFTWKTEDGKNRKAEGKILDYKSGDSIVIRYEGLAEGETDAVNGRMKVVKREIYLDAVTDRRPFGLEKYQNTMIITRISDFYAFVDIKSNTAVCYMADDAEKVQDAISNYIADNNIIARVQNYDSEIKKYKSIISLVSAVAYGLIAVIALIGITNIINTVTTGIELRMSEFASLKSIGMTSREFRKMMRLEALFVGGKALMIGVPAGCILSGVLYYLEITFGDMIAFSLPVTGIVLNIVIVFVTMYVIMEMAVVKVNNRNIIDTIKNENI